jgi:HSP90 family molecular chaperone
MAKASEIIVQLALTETKTTITVEDNGIGYDKNNLEMSSILEYLKNIKFTSRENKRHILRCLMDMETMLPIILVWKPPVKMTLMLERLG